MAVEVADAFLGRVRARALSEEVMKSLTPAQQVIKVVREELQETLGGEHRKFVLPSGRTAVVMMAGVQGSGKTTACAKLALRLKKDGRRPLLVAADLERPAAVEQLFTLGDEVDVPVVSEGRDPVKVAKSAMKEAERRGNDVVIIDTAGRLHVDVEMMKQARRIRDAVKPDHVLMACDAMTGQDAVIQAREFLKEVETTGFVLTKLDGDARGGAALSITAVTGRPVFFAGVGEKPEDLEDFYPDRMAGRIMGMGDVLSLIDKANEKLDADDAKASAEKMLQGAFTLEDFLASAPADAAARTDPGSAEDAPGDAGREERHQGDRRPGGRGQAPPGGGPDPVHDAGGATESRYHLRVSPPADRPRGGLHHLRRQHAPQGLRGREEDDADDDGRREGPSGHDLDAAEDIERPEAIARGHAKMTTRIRLRRMGSNKRPFFRVVVADQRSPRDGRFIENIGKYHPLDDPSVIEIDQDRALHWLRVGAQPSNQVRNLMNKIGIWDEFVKERPSAAAGPAKERTSKPKLSKKAKQKAEAAASEPEQAAVQETPQVSPQSRRARGR